MTTAYEYICGALAERFGTPEELLGGEARFIEDIGLSSLDVVVLLSDAEDELGITVSDEAVLSMKTLSGAASVISSLTGMPTGRPAESEQQTGGEGQDTAPADNE